nr:MAG TPA: hypothetical protein [Caudoviricetes sp.]
MFAHHSRPHLSPTLSHSIKRTNNTVKAPFYATFTRFVRHRRQTKENGQKAPKKPSDRPCD